MTRTERLALEAARAAASPYGVTVEFTTGGKHHALILTAPDGQWTKLAVSSSPAEVDVAGNYARQQTAAWMQRLGLMQRGVAGKRKARRVVARRDRQQPMPDLSGVTKLHCDPWAALQGGVN